MSPIDEKFLGHAAANDAGAAHPMLLRDRHFRSMGGRDTRRPNAARSRTNYAEVIIIVAHAKNSRCRTGLWRRLQWVTTGFCCYKLSIKQPNNSIDQSKPK